MHCVRDTAVKNCFLFAVFNIITERKQTDVTYRSRLNLPGIIIRREDIVSTDKTVKQPPVTFFTLSQRSTGFFFLGDIGAGKENLDGTTISVVENRKINFQQSFFACPDDNGLHNGIVTVGGEGDNLSEEMSGRFSVFRVQEFDEPVLSYQFHRGISQNLAPF